MSRNDVEDRNDVDRHSAAVHRHDAAQIFRFVIVAALIAAIVIVGMDNRDDVRIGYAFGDVQAPVWIVLVLAAITGVVIGWLVRHRASRTD